MAEQDRLPSNNQIFKYDDLDPDRFIFEEEDDYVQQPGQVRALDLAYAKHIRPRIVAAFEAAPDDATGKQSPWYPQLQAWMVLFDQFLASKSHTDLFALIPTMVEFRSGAPRNDLSQKLNKLIGLQKEATSETIIRAMADCIREANGEIFSPLLQKFVHFHSVWHLSDPWREDEFIPIDEAGIFIPRPSGEELLIQATGGDGGGSYLVSLVLRKNGKHTQYECGYWEGWLRPYPYEVIKYLGSDENGNAIVEIFDWLETKDEK